MRIVIDMQGAQTESRFRGIGRYTLSFAQAVVRNRGEHEVILALSGLFPGTIEPIRAAFDGLLPQENIRVWCAPGPVKAEHPDNDARRETAELIREAFLASLQPDVIYISSLFEGYVDDAVTSIGLFDRTTPVSISLYDLIPLLNPDQYLTSNSSYATYYERKVASLRQAKLMLAISEYSRQEGLHALDQRSEKIVNVGTAIGDEFKPINITPEESAALRDRFGLTREFVLYTGGADERKNLPRLIEAWSALPPPIRQAHQLLFAGRMPECNVVELRQLARRHGLQQDELLFSGYVSDEELVQLYNLCKLYVFPSWHEGFGLPALEAMACGAAAIGANTTSLPEVIGLQDALFDPFDVAEISKKMAQALEYVAFNTRLRTHGLQQAKKFSWEETAKRAITAWESLHKTKLRQASFSPQCRSKPRLAYVSPMPPERTGIADYSAELLPALSAYYDIELIVAQKEIDDPWVNEHGNVRDETWLRTHVDEIDRVVYQIGNSPFHRHMLCLLEDIPGTVVLHDFYLSGLMAWQELCGGEAGAWVSALYDSHGYGAVRDRFADAEGAKEAYPVNWRVLQQAQGIIVHSNYSRGLASQWHGTGSALAWETIPLLRAPADVIDRHAARRALGIKDDDFVICSFGFLDQTKLNHRLLSVWLNCALAHDKRCHLVFVGENHGGEYGASLLKTIRDSGVGERIRITGFASPEVFRQYLAAADLAVQLRARSRGETSAAVLDCMNHALPLIVNANGSMAELDSGAAWVLPDEFTDAEIIDALHTLWSDSERRHALGARAKQIIRERHAPDECARQYVEAIERFHSQAKNGLPALISAIAEQTSLAPDDALLLRLSQAIATNFPLAQPAKRLFLDVTATCRHDLRTGIERVARSLILALLESPPKGYRIEPVYLCEAGEVTHHRYARSYTLSLLGCPEHVLRDEPIEPAVGDILLTLDLSGETLVRAEKGGLFGSYRQKGVSVYATVFDLLPVQLPGTFPPNSEQVHESWLQAISGFDGAVCISKCVADDLRAWYETNELKEDGRRPFSIGWFHLGSDVASSAPSRGLPITSDAIFQQLRARPSFLMVGTIEPRKGYLQTLDQFDQIWSEGLDVNLVIVGYEGWKGLQNEMRRDIPETVNRIRTHPELNKRLFWLEGISDEYLENIYSLSTCLIAASYGEGFGLPLIEAAEHKLPIIARDIGVFREVMGDCAYYFSATDADGLSKAIIGWMNLFEKHNHPSSNGVSRLTWLQSATQLKNVIFGRRWSHRLSSNEIKLRAMNSHLNLIHNARVSMLSTFLPEGDIILDLGGANSPLYKMGFEKKFKKLYLIDLPPEERCEMYKEILVDPDCEGGEVVIKYGDMTELDAFDDESVDMVWSGQSIEHVPFEAGRRMCHAAFRVLRPGGAFCLDTPNRLLTRIHTRDIGGGFIHPEHYIEYVPAQLRQLLEEAGFVIEKTLGICEMPVTSRCFDFDYTDFIYGDKITDQVEESYIQFFHCVKPR